ncbi:MAG TPA: arylsulfotransferase family protein [Thermoleophilaceae bacterium]|nr:arylsulfotransferase family protein [Thermoleophilaceae bacterium]
MTTRGRLGAGAALATAVWFGAAAAPAPAKVEIDAKPSLRPAFERKVSDYVSRCEPGRALEVSVNATDGDRVKVAGTRKRGGEYVRKVRRATGEGFEIRVDRGERTTTHHVRCLPRDFPRWSFERHGSAQAQWYVVAPVKKEPQGYVAVFSARGAPVWWFHSSSWGPWDGKLLPDGNLAWARWWVDNFGVRDEAAYEVRRLDGRLVRTVRTVGNPTDTHDMQQLPNGNVLAISYRRRCCVDLSAHGAPKDAEVFDGEIQELDPAGRLVWRWNSKDHIPLSWTREAWWELERRTVPIEPATENAYDLVHLNSVEPDRDGLIVSARHLDSVFRIDRETGAIDWKLGGRHVPGTSLKVVGDHPSPLLGGQHDARLWKDGTLTVHDNASWTDNGPAADRFAIDPAKRTARLVERVQNPHVKYETAIGSARKLRGGNWVVSWGPSPEVTEQRESGAIVRRFRFRDRFTYRAAPIEPGALSASALRHGMDRMKAAQRGARR